MSDKINISNLPQDRLLTVSEVAEMFRVKPATIYTMVSRGQIPGIKLGSKQLRFRPDVIQKLLDEGIRDKKK